MLGRTLPRTALRSSQCLAPSRLSSQTPRPIRPIQRPIYPSQRCLRDKYTITIDRSTGKGSRSEQFSDAFRKHPIYASIATGIIVTMLGMLGYANYIYITYIVGAYHNFPEEVAKPLRKAVFYTNMQEDPQLALKWYKEALRVIEEIGMDPFSNEVLGVKIQLAALFEKHHSFPNAIRILEQVRSDCFKYVELLGEKHMNDGKRTRVLGKTVAIGIKLGELYSSAAVDDQEAAEAVLISAVETMLSEKQRREREGVQAGEGEWATDEENGATLEALGNQFEATDKYHLAAPLFLQALALCPPKSCHSVILMNNLATCLAQQRPPPSFAASTSRSSSSPPPPLPTPADFRAQATLWARKALELSKAIAPPDRNEECDVGCAVATHNLGEFAEMSGNLAEASQLYHKAEILARGIGFKDGVEQARAALIRVNIGEKGARL